MVVTKRNKKVRKPLTPSAGLIIGLTGGIGSGKSFALECFAKLGFTIFDVDKAIHGMLLKGSPVYKQVAELYPETAGSKEIDRKKLGALAFHNEKVLQKIEDIILPKVREIQLEFYKNQGGISVVFEVPTLFEKQREDYYDYIFVTHAPIEIRQRRTLRRKHMTLSKFRAIVASQVSEQIRLKKADFIIDTNTTKAQTFKQLKGLLNG